MRLRIGTVGATDLNKFGRDPRELEADAAGRRKEAERRRKSAPDERRGEETHAARDRREPKLGSRESEFSNRAALAEDVFRRRLERCR